MQEIILVVYLVISIALIGIILLQQGKGAEMGASFGAGGANTVFGAAGSGSVLTKMTTILAILFFATALSISYFNSTSDRRVDAVLDEVDGAEKIIDQQTRIEAEVPSEVPDINAEVAPENNEKSDINKAELTDGTQSEVEETAETLIENKKEKIQVVSEKNVKEANAAVIDLKDKAAKKKDELNKKNEVN